MSNDNININNNDNSVYKNLQECPKSCKPTIDSYTNTITNIPKTKEINVLGRTYTVNMQYSIGYKFIRKRKIKIEKIFNI